MGASSRTKGRKGEREVARLWELAGFTVRNLESQGDHLLVPNVTMDAERQQWLALHQEVKRQERPRVNEWWKQAVAEAPAGTIAVVTFRPSYAPWLSMLATTDLIRLVS